MLYVFAYPAGDYSHLSVLTQVSFQIGSSGSLWSKRMCKKISKEKPFYFQLVSLPISKQKRTNLFKNIFHHSQQ